MQCTDLSVRPIIEHLSKTNSALFPPCSPPPNLSVSAAAAFFTNRRQFHQQRCAQRSELPAHHCLSSHGINQSLLGDMYWSSPLLAQYSQERVQADLEPMLTALSQEGVSAQQAARLLRHSELLACSAEGLLENLGHLNQLLRHIGRGQLEASSGWTAGVSVSGLLVARSPACLATYLSRPPGSLAANSAWLEQHCGVDAPKLAHMVFRRPCLLTATVGPDLNQILGILDSLKGQPGWGRQLMESDPLVATYTLATVQANLETLKAAGYTPEELCAELAAQPNLLVLPLSGPAYRTRFAWIRQASTWALSHFLREPKYLTALSVPSTAPRVAYFQDQGLALPPGPDRLLVLSSEAAFCKGLKGVIGRELGVEEWRDWVRRWLLSEEGKRWGSSEDA